ncbi:hypothetical protein Tco_0072720 [Tanacetum coccineum]
MASFDYRLNPVFTIKECSSCGAWYNKSCGCSKGCFVDKFVINSNKTPDLSQQTPNCPKCGNPVEGLYCRQCALIRKKLEEVSQDFQDTSESSNDNPDIVDAPQEPFVFNQDPGENSLPSPPQIDHCCHECGDSLDGIFCRRCTCKVMWESFASCPAEGVLSDHEEFADELTHIMPLPDLECFHFKNNPDPGDLTSIDLRIRENMSTTNVNTPLEDDQSSLFAYVVWIFLDFLMYPVKFQVIIQTLNESLEMILSPLVSSPWDNEFGVEVRAVTRKQNKALQLDFPDCEDSRFYHSLELHILSFI